MKNHELIRIIPSDDGPEIPTINQDPINIPSGSSRKSRKGKVQSTIILLLGLIMIGSMTLPQFFESYKQSSLVEAEQQADTIKQMRRAQNRIQAINALVQGVGDIPLDLTDEEERDRFMISNERNWTILQMLQKKVNTIIESLSKTLPLSIYSNDLIELNNELIIMSKSYLDLLAACKKVAFNSLEYNGINENVRNLRQEVKTIQEKISMHSRRAIQKLEAIEYQFVSEAKE